MPTRSPNRTFTWLLLIATAIVALAFFFVTPKKEVPTEIKQAPIVAQEEPVAKPTIRLIGRSAEGRDIEAYSYGD